MILLATSHRLGAPARAGLSPSRTVTVSLESGGPVTRLIASDWPARRRIAKLEGTWSQSPKFPAGESRTRTGPECTISLRVSSLAVTGTAGELRRTRSRSSTVLPGTVTTGKPEKWPGPELGAGGGKQRLGLRSRPNHHRPPAPGRGRGNLRLHSGSAAARSQPSSSRRPGPSRSPPPPEPDDPAGKIFKQIRRRAAGEPED